MPPQPTVDLITAQVRQAEELNRSLVDAVRGIGVISPQLLMPAPSKPIADALAAISSANVLSALGTAEVFRQRQLPGLQKAIATLGPRLSYAELLRPELVTDQVLGQLTREFTAVQTQMARWYTETLVALRPFAPDLMTSVTEVLRSHFASRSYLQWMVAAELHERSWWLVPSWDDALLRRVLKAVDGRRGQRALVQVLRAHYERDRCRALGKMVASWTLPEITSRRALLRDAVVAYRSRRYRVAVKLITGIEEAVLKEFLIRTGRIDAKTARNTKAPKLLKLHVTKGRSALVPFEIAFGELFTDFVWGTKWRGGEVKRTHLAHGGVPQNRPVLALRLFLIIDTLNHFLARLPEPVFR